MSDPCQQSGTSHISSPSSPLSMMAGALIIALLALILQPGLASAAWQGETEMRGDVKHVMNPARAAQLARTIELEELWRLGGDSDDPNEFFGLINSILSDDDGNIYLLDAQLTEIKVYSPGGEFLHSMGREGEGPGEFRNPSGMVFTPDGKLGVTVMIPGRIVLLSPTGEAAGEQPIPVPEGAGFTLLLSSNCKQDNLSLVLGYNRFEGGKMVQTRNLVRIDPAGLPICTFAEREMIVDFASSIIDETQWDGWENRWSMGPDGRVYAVETWGEYAISVWSPDGEKQMVIEREFKPRKRNQEELDRLDEIWSAFLRQLPNAQIKISPHDQAVFRTYAREDGSLWVHNSYGSHEQPDDLLGTFDVFDGEGRFQREITLQGQGNPRTDGYFFVRDRLYVVTGFLEAAIAMQTGGDSVDLGEGEDAEPMTVICYKLPLGLD